MGTISGLIKLVTSFTVQKQNIKICKRAGEGADHTPEYVHDLNVLVDLFDEGDRRAFVGDNARHLFKI